MEKDYVILKRASASRLSVEWNEDDFDVLANGKLSGRILEATPAGTKWPIRLSRTICTP